ncbi:uncharacterized protein TRIVIDRAFT_92146 [Trichoderma virens Gv29-8]|uniref:Uncharacterized protein n=1 Tax=Hypocrea virens (strain Gv29-8 / FGSC 10586) TaxID=413071 RepID=G9MNQ8_HYPVG|nr:uncharacterized protein TRIVIDRAFT_92146 [Trichoderma virens Gv29-8]EHK23513.1 hypothetical protein TRIVIDRAFT_92146 [Trichoderma virens Gv29-8]
MAGVREKYDMEPKASRVEIWWTRVCIFAIESVMYKSVMYIAAYCLLVGLITRSKTQGGPAL